MTAYVPWTPSLSLQILSEPEYDCFGTKSDAHDWCLNNGDEDTLAYIACSGNLQGETGSPYDPSSYVTYNSSTQEYEIDNSFVEAMIENQFVQIAADGARFELQTSGYYKLVNVRSGDLMDELGLQSNDVLKSIDGKDLGSFENQVDAYLNLKNDTQLSLTIERGTSTLVIDYKIVP